MDLFNKVSNYSSHANNTTSSVPGNQQETAGGGGGFMGAINDRLGGGRSGEQKEDLLDKGVDFVQEHVLGQGPQNNESAAEQFKDEQISDAIRRGFKQTTGNDFPVDDK
ncbi:hypothetical protein NMY22_g3328 [Coprinellus aureogranulatus]|nr:hypothetical protein NMY22_g3328 [Coprinellus aureogranulatus]